MKFSVALRAFMEKERLQPEHLAIASGKSTYAVNAWLIGESEPKIGDVLRIKQAYPSLGDFLDKVAA